MPLRKTPLRLDARLCSIDERFLVCAPRRAHTARGKKRGAPLGMTTRGDVECGSFHPSTQHRRAGDPGVLLASTHMHHFCPTRSRCNRDGGPRQSSEGHGCSTSGQARTADSGGEPPHSTWRQAPVSCEADGAGGASITAEYFLVDATVGNFLTDKWHTPWRRSTTPDRREVSRPAHNPVKGYFPSCLAKR